VLFFYPFTGKKASLISALIWHTNAIIQEMLYRGKKKA